MLPASLWLEIEPGLDLAEIRASVKSSHGDSTIRVLRIDPDRFEVVLGMVSEHGELRTAEQWSKQEGFVAAINASMFQTDYRTSVALMKTRDHTNNPKTSADKAVLAFDPKVSGVPPVQIIDRACQDFDALREKYHGLVQSIRMVSCEGRNVWAQQPRKWSTAAVGIDARGRLLFIHCRSPYSTHDFINELQKAPIDLKNAMYVEGGPEAQLYLRSGSREREWVGSFETGFRESDDNAVAWPIPNVIGVRRKAFSTP